MARWIPLPTHRSKGGNLTVVDQGAFGFDVRRVFWIYASGDTRRGEHRHKSTVQAAVCVAGACVIDTDDGHATAAWALDAPDKCLLLEPRDWHAMHSFTADAVLMVFASAPFDADDYVFEPYR